jgi:hypothetical protein
MDNLDDSFVEMWLSLGYDMCSCEQPLVNLEFEPEITYYEEIEYE